MKIVLYILVLSILVFGCKKYPEDKTLVHLQKAKNRLWRGNTWYITGYAVNGADSMAYLNNYYYWHAPIGELGQKIRKDDLIDNNNKLMFGWGHIGKSSPEKNIWEIKRLDKNILWLEQVGYNNTIYRLELKGSQ